MQAIVLSYSIDSHCSLRHVLGLAAPGSRFGHLWYNVCSWVLFVLVDGVEGWMVGGPSVCKTGGNLLQIWWPTLRQAWLNDIHSGWCILEITASGRGTKCKLLSIWTWRSSSADTILTQCSYQLQRGVGGRLPLLSRTEWVHPQSHRTSQRTGLEHQTSHDQLSLLEDQRCWMNST